MKRCISRSLLVLAIVSIALPCFAQKKTSFSLTKVPDQWAQVRGVPEIVADQKCENYAWAASLETILKKENVTLDQKYWIDKLNGGSVCQPSAGSLADLAKLVDGNYILPDGRKFKLQTRYVEGAPTSTDRLLTPLAWGRPYIMWWKQHAYVVDGALWDEYVYPSGQKQLEMREIGLIDTFETGDKRKTKFVAGKDQSTDINGIFEVVITPVESESPWKP
jgi:hypothetical protein